MTGQIVLVFFAAGLVILVIFLAMNAPTTRPETAQELQTRLIREGRYMLMIFSLVLLVAMTLLTVILLNRLDEIASILK